MPVPDGPIDADMVAHLEEAFGQEHERTYGHRAGPEEPVELVAIQLVGSGLREGGERAAARDVEPDGTGRAGCPPSLFRRGARLDGHARVEPRGS